MASPYLMLCTVVMTLALINVSEGGKVTSPTSPTNVPSSETIGSATNVPLGSGSNLSDFESGKTIDVDECNGRPCQNGGTCSNTNGHYICKCAGGWTGINCSIEIMKCEGYSFFFGGSVFKTGEGYYTKSQAENVCQQHGATLPSSSSDKYRLAASLSFAPISSSCVIAYVQNFISSRGANGEGGNVWSNQCEFVSPVGLSCNLWIIRGRHGYPSSLPPEGNVHVHFIYKHFIYPVCQKDINECNGKPCQHGGTCSNTNGSYVCKCAAGWTGVNCSIALKSPLTAPPTTTPTTTPPTRSAAVAACQCDTVGSVNTTCSLTTPQCICNYGYTGLKCESCLPSFYRHFWKNQCLDIDECNGKPCQNGGTCSNTNGSFICKCAAGWTGINCSIDINECTSGTHNCHGKANCTNNDGFFTCKCQDGYSGDGTACSVCADGKYGANCASSCGCVHGVCNKVNGSCTCSPGYIGVDCNTECSPGTYGLDCLYACSCRNGATCNSVHGACTCTAGYTSVHCGTDINECISGTHTCHVNANCTNNEGSFKCTCQTGYSGDGTTCSALKSQLTTTPTTTLTTTPNTSPTTTPSTAPTTTSHTRSVAVAACKCDTVGSVNTTCSLTTPQCICNYGYTGLKCESCLPSFYRHFWQNQCLDCQCAIASTIHTNTTSPPMPICSKVGNVGQCLCKPGYKGHYCSLCAGNTFFNDTTKSCQKCNCDIKGAISYHCLHWPGDTRNGKCTCRPGYAGLRCQFCASTYTRELASGECIAPAVPVYNRTLVTQQGTVLFAINGRRRGYDWFQANNDCIALNTTLPDEKTSFSDLLKLTKPYFKTLNRLHLKFWTKKCSYFYGTNRISNCMMMRLPWAIRSFGYLRNVSFGDVLVCMKALKSPLTTTPTTIPTTTPTTTPTTAPTTTPHTRSAAVAACKCDTVGSVNTTCSLTTPQCICNYGYTGLKCESCLPSFYRHFWQNQCLDINECNGKPCQNGGTCSNTNGSYVCKCAGGWTGINCSIDYNECASNPCLNNGACHNRLNHYHCKCNPGFTGHNCESGFNECASHPCLNNGACHNRPNHYQCKCNPGFTGHNCESEVLECKGYSFFFGGSVLKTGQSHYTKFQTQNLCQQHGATLPSGSGASPVVRPVTASCVIAYVQNFISSRGVNGEAGNVWSNQCYKFSFGSAPEHTCNIWVVYGRDSKNAFRTNLYQNRISEDGNKHFIYPVCQKDIDECQKLQCWNGATCKNTDGSYTCQCALGNSGTHCEYGLDTTCRAMGSLPAGRFASSNFFSYKPLSHGTVMTAGSQSQAIDICSQNGGDIPHFVPRMCAINVQSPEVLPYTRDTDKSQIQRTVMCQRPVQICKGYGTLQVPRGHDFRRMVTYEEANDLCRSEPKYDFELAWQYPQSEACMNKLLDRMQAVFGMHQRPQVWYEDMGHVQGKRAVVCRIWRSNEFFTGSASHIDQYSYSKMWKSQP